MLFCNAGVGEFISFKDSDDDLVHRTMTVNTLQPVFTIKALLEQLIARDHRTAVVITGSGFAMSPVPGLMSYSATKICASYFGEGLNFELTKRSKGAKIDVMTWEAGKVATRMIPDRLVDANCSQVDEAVSGMLKHIGRECNTGGSRKQTFQRWLFKKLPKSIFYNFAWKEFAAPSVKDE